ncbi:replication endonuclease [Orrella sp. 11846]|uniref:replication endonuclease n=1 Tax=Orrella sp. 11846 TaxID=3409913 RepID=UPI003B5A927E
MFVENLDICADHTLSVSPGNAENFAEYLSQRVRPTDVIRKELETLKLERLPWQWWWHAREAAVSAIYENGVESLSNRFKEIVQNLSVFSNLGLHVGASATQIKRSYFNLLRNEISCDLNLAQITTRLAQAVDSIARDLNLHKIESNHYVSSIARDLMKMKMYFQKEALSNTMKKTGREVSDRLFEQRMIGRCADQRHRLEETVKFCEQDLRWFGCVFYMTCPSFFHPILNYGVQNPSWVMAGKPSPQVAYEWLMSVWQKAYNKAKQKNIEIIGFRTVEPHRSGVPHFNLLLYFKSEKSAHYFREILLSVYDNEKLKTISRLDIQCQITIAQNNRSLPIVIRKIQAFGDAVQAAKYVSKSLVVDGVDIGESNAELNNVDDSCDRSNSTSEDEKRDWSRIYCSLWGMRQFTEIGTGQNITVWNALKSATSESIDSDILENLPVELVTVWLSASPNLRSYRTFLRMTHPCTPLDKRMPAWNRIQQVISNLIAFDIIKQSNNHRKVSSIYLFNESCGVINKEELSILYLINQSNNIIFKTKRGVCSDLQLVYENHQVVFD